jgi:hypothetical protein
MNSRKYRGPIRPLSFDLGPWEPGIFDSSAPAFTREMASQRQWPTEATGDPARWLMMAIVQWPIGSSLRRARPWIS